MADQKVRTLVPRVRNNKKNKEVPLKIYELLQSPRNADEGVLRRILKRLSCHNYEACAEVVPEAFELSPPTISILTLYRLGLFPQLGSSIKTTNCIESLMALGDDYTGKVDYWRNSSQKHRWVASAFIAVADQIYSLKI